MIRPMLVILSKYYYTALYKAAGSLSSYCQRIKQLCLLKFNFEIKHNSHILIMINNDHPLRGFRTHTIHYTPILITHTLISLLLQNSTGRGIGWKLKTWKSFSANRTLNISLLLKIIIASWYFQHLHHTLFCRFYYRWSIYRIYTYRSYDL